MTQASNFDRLGDLYSHMQRCIAHLVVYEGEEIISTGTGFAISADGALLTAAHVVAGGFPVREGEVNQANRIIVAFFVMQDWQMLYRPFACPVQIVGKARSKPLQLDVALLGPAQKPAKALHFLRPSIELPQLGDEMYFGGYSEEVEMPFLVDRHLPPNTEGLQNFQRAFLSGVKARIAGPIIKRGTVGNVILGSGVSEGKVSITPSVFYLDNQINYGASGGPVVARDGTVRGLISKRTVTKADGLDVPAGSTLCADLSWLTQLANAQPQQAA